MKHKNSAFILAALLIHIGCIVAGRVFFGPEYTVILALLWAISWVGYCAYLQMHDEHAYAKATYLKLVLVGGPLCWLICPWALWPAKHDKNTEPATWIMLLKVYMAFEVSFIKLMNLLFDLATDTPEAQATPKAAETSNAAAPNAAETNQAEQTTPDNGTVNEPTADDTPGAHASDPKE